MKNSSFIKTLSISMLAISLAISSAGAVSAKVTVTDSESYLTKMLKQRFPDIQIADRYYDDFDGDGRKELFVISGSGYDLDADSAIYFSSENMLGVLDTNIGYISYDETERERVIDIGGGQKIFAVETSWGGSSSVTRYYYVKKGEAKIPAQSLSGLTHISGSRFMICGDAFDAYKDTGGMYTGHTYRMYYVKWTGSEFKEYTSKYISKSDFKKFDGSSDILKKISSKGYTVDKIIKRANGIININIHKKSGSSTRYDNLTMKLSDNKVKLKKVDPNGSGFAGKYSYGGIYRKYILR